MRMRAWQGSCVQRCNSTQQATKTKTRALWPATGARGRPLPAWRTDLRGSERSWSRASAAAAGARPSPLTRDTPACALLAAERDRPLPWPSNIKKKEWSTRGYSSGQAIKGAATRSGSERTAEKNSRDTRTVSQRQPSAGKALLRMLSSQTEAERSQQQSPLRIV
jgi:hypothetical protein